MEINKPFAIFMGIFKGTSPYDEVELLVRKGGGPAGI